MRDEENKSFVPFQPSALSPHPFPRRIGIDGIPLATPKAGIGHYTFELARCLARLAPADEFELVAPVAVELGAGRDADELPPNLRTVHAPTGVLRRRWWTIGLPLYVRQNRLTLFHGT